MPGPISNNRMVRISRYSAIRDGSAGRAATPAELPDDGNNATIAPEMTHELSPSQAAARIGATTRSVQRWIASGRLPARRIGGRWRVASDAVDAFGRADHTGATEPTERDGTERPIRRLFVANRGEIANRIGRTCDRLGIDVIVPATDGPSALDLLDIDA